MLDENTVNSQDVQKTIDQLEEDIPIIFYPSAAAYDRSREAKGVLITNALAITESNLYEMLRNAVATDMSKHVERIQHEDPVNPEG